jgi:hypothetical protein
MKVEALKQRLDRNRPMTSVTIRMPKDVVEDLKKVAPLLGFSGYQPLICAYISQCLRVDLERFESETVIAFVASLKQRIASIRLTKAGLDTPQESLGSDPELALDTHLQHDRR